MLDSRRLLYFLRIAESGSFSQAAASLGVAQPALSHHVRQLEEYLGTTLLIRRARGVVVTEAGAKLMEHARVIVEGMERAEQELRSGAQQIVGAVNLGLASSIAASLAPRLLRDIRERHPGIVLHIIEGTSTALAEWVKADRLDLAVNLEGVAQDRAAHLFNEDLYFVGPPGSFAHLGCADIEFADVVTYPLVVPTRPHSMRRLIERTAAERGLSIRIALEIDGHESLKAVLTSGLGCSILSWAAIHVESAEGKISASRIVNPIMRRTVVLDTSPRGRSSRATMVVGDAIREAVRKFHHDKAWRGLLPTPAS
ncbi:MAG: LysR substrate-binding domain-containing protein [Rhodopila sp.]|nr:LysR substrate-binding domain-containing protein [Rhodopila sp.]